MRYIGSSDTGRCPTPASAFGAIATVSSEVHLNTRVVPAARKVHAFLLSLTHVMYPLLSVSYYRG
jgi:hypothetical protein